MEDMMGGIILIIYTVFMAGVVSYLSRDRKEAFKMILGYAAGMIIVLIMMFVNDRIKY